MRLLPIPDASGSPTMWINADHLVSVVRQQRRAPEGIELSAELKIDGMPLYRVALGIFLEERDADAAWSTFLRRLEAGE